MLYFFICLFYLWPCSTFSSEKNCRFLNAQMSYQFFFFFNVCLPGISTFITPPQPIAGQDNCSLCFLHTCHFENFLSLLLCVISSLFPGTPVCLFLTNLFCWNTSSSSFLRKDAWEVGFMSPCISENVLFLDLILNLAENRFPV